DLLRLPGGEPRRQVLILLDRDGLGLLLPILFLLSLGSLILLPAFLLDVEDLPPHLVDQRAGAVIAVEQRLANTGRRRGGDGGDHRRHRPDVVVVPGREEAPA